MQGTQLFVSLFAAGLIDMNARRPMTHMSVPAYLGSMRSHAFVFGLPARGVYLR